jgi:hypothetical protein
VVGLVAALHSSGVLSSASRSISRRVRAAGHPAPTRRRGTTGVTTVRTMAERQLRTVLEGGGFFEGPRWHDGTWRVSDSYRHTVSRVTPDGAETVVVEVEGRPSGSGWLPDGSLVVVSMKDHRVLRYADGTLSTHADLTEHCGGHLNDLLVTEAGQVFVSDFGFDLMGSGDARSASLERVDPDGTVSVAAEGLQSPTAW